MPRNPKPLLLLLMTSLALSDTEGFAATDRLAVGGRARAITFADVDGDGDRDALVATVLEGEGRPEKAVELFLRARGRFPSSAAARVVVAEDALLLDAADLDQDGRAELLVLREDGLDALAFEEGAFVAPTRVVELASFFRATAGGELPFVDLAKDIDFDGRDDLLLPGHEGYVFYRGARQGGVEEPHTLVSESSHGVDRGPNEAYRMSSRLARPTPVDWDGDRVGDLMLSFDKQLLRVPLGRSGAPSSVEVLHDLSELIDGGAAAAGGLVTHDGRLRDIDGDGRCDLLFAQRVARPGLMNAATTRNVVFLADDLRKGRAPKPRQVIRTEGVTSPPRLFDLDADGALDLIVTTVRTDLMSKLRESMLDAVRVTFFVFRFDKDAERFESEPMVSETLRMPADRLLEVGAYGWVAFKADYTGDGRPDLATYHAREGVLRVRKGYEDSGFFSSTEIAYEDDAFFETKVALTAPFFAEDIDGDGRSELVAVNEDHALVVTVGSGR